LAGDVLVMAKVAHRVLTLIIGSAFHARSAVKRRNGAPRSLAGHIIGAAFIPAGLALVSEDPCHLENSLRDELLQWRANVSAAA
jgi:hypothetical protein